MGDYLFPAEPGVRAIARELYGHTRGMPIVSPHGHVDPAMLAGDEPFPDPARLLIVPDHYVTRLLVSQGVAPERLGVARLDGGPVEEDGRAIWRVLAENWHLFRGTPSRLWLELTFREVFGLGDVRLGPETADDVYDAIAGRLAEPGFRPRALFERFGIETLATTESPLDPLEHHDRLAADGWGKRVITTFRPDDVVDMDNPRWADAVRRLGELTGEDTEDYDGYLNALRARREYFKARGATATDHGHPTAGTAELDREDAARMFKRRLNGTVVDGDAELFRGHMLVEFARMSVEDGLVLQLHPGPYRDHDAWLRGGFGANVGGDIPTATEYTRALKPLLDRFGHEPGFRMVVFTLDESAFTRELAPLAGVYPAMYLGAPWWFLDSPEGLRRFRETVTETAGFYNTAGFADDTRAFCSIPVRHQVARRIDAAFLARLVAEDRLPLDEAAQTAADLAYRLPKHVYKL
ncbi:glucuronate isomerase [Thermopolyspora sp. NPDC052614]|uniref:glucuronate isomerase n=1 Tax=Thermopolyspora sp. NPDC052614 TaxID=3155682 RepID=UPI00343A6C9E